MGGSLALVVALVLALVVALVVALLVALVLGACCVALAVDHFVFSREVEGEETLFQAPLRAGTLSVLVRLM